MRIHKLIQHIEERVETDLRVWRYLLPKVKFFIGPEICTYLVRPRNTRPMYRAESRGRKRRWRR